MSMDRGGVQGLRPAFPLLLRAAGGTQQEQKKFFGGAYTQSPRLRSPEPLAGRLRLPAPSLKGRNR